MPGIVGRIGGDPSLLRNETQTMVGSLLHEPFYENASFISDRLRLGLGAAAHRGSFASRQPFWNADRTVCLVFAGECYGLDEIAPSAGRETWDEDSAICLVALYEQFGLSFVEKLNGIFSGALVDLRANKVFLFNDRYGLGRIYYYQGNDAFYFASEAKALLSVRRELRRIDPTGFAEQLSCGCTLQNRTLFDGVSLLPGGSLWTLTGDGSVKQARYFDPTKWETEPSLNAASYHRALEETFMRVLPRYLRGESVGMSLTGGLDGRMIMAYARTEKRRYPCYTFGGTYRDCADVSIARKVARVLDLSHQVIPVGHAFLQQFPALAERSVYISDGTMDVGGAVELYANRLAREIAPIRLTGNYGSEILRGNVAFRPNADVLPFLSGDFDLAVRRADAGYYHERQGRALSLIAFKQVPWHHYSRLSIEQSQLVVRSPYLDNDLVSLAYCAPASQQKSASALRLVFDRNRELARIPTDRGLLCAPRPLLTKLTRAAQEFFVKAEYAYDYGMPQWLAQVNHVLAPVHLERVFLGRHKFYHFRVWYRDQLAPFVREVLLDPVSLARPYLRRPAVERLVENHVSGRRNYTTAIHKLLSAEFIHRKFVDADPAHARHLARRPVELVHE